MTRFLKMLCSREQADIYSFGFWYFIILTVFKSNWWP